MTKYWMSPLGNVDDFNLPYIGDVMYDAKTRMGPWANMSEKSWQTYRASPNLGLGLGQKYVKQTDGRWMKVEG